MILSAVGKVCMLTFLSMPAREWVSVILLHGFETLKYYKLHTAPVIMRYSTVGSTGQFQIMLFLTVGCEVILNCVTCFFYSRGELQQT